MILATQKTKAALLRSVATGALSIALAMVIVPATSMVSGAVYAESHSGGDGNGNGGNNGNGNGGNNGNGGGGSDNGGHEDGDDHDDEDHDDSDHEDGDGGNGSGSGNAPVWAGEGIPEVELGRMNVARSPSHVLDRALAEALANLTPGQIAFLNLSLEEMIDALRDEFDDLSLIDSPLQNLSLLRDALDGITDLAAFGVTNDLDTLMAAFIGLASDKTQPITADSVIALTTILGYPITGTDAEELAEAAEAIRDAVEDGHG